jgi:CP family cyanate transporter-like MFS transporter
VTTPAPLPSGARSLTRGRLLAFIGIALVALTMRTAVGSMSPIIGLIDDDLHLDSLVLSVIGASPPLIFALSGLLAPLIARALGLEGSLVVLTLLGGIGHLLRAIAPEPGVLLAGTVLALLGAGCCNVLLPPVVKRYFPDRIGTVTALYVTVMSLGATVPPIVAVPIAEGASWRVSLGAWCVLAVVAAAPWVLQLVRSGRHVENLNTEARGIEAASAGIGRRLFRSRIAWSMALLFATPTISVYAMFAWLPSMAAELSGVDAVQAGALLGAFAICGVPAALIVPVLAVRLRSVRPLILVGLGFFVAGFAGFLFAPTWAPLVWSVFIGLGPLMFPLTLTLINLRTRSQIGAVALSGFVQGFGYVIGAAGPLVVGMLRDATGGWTVPILFLLATLVLAIPALVVLSRSRFVEDELAR